MAEEAAGESRWAWDFYPLSKNAWAARKSDVKPDAVGREIVIIPSFMRDSGTHKLYAPTDAELLLVAPFCPADEPGLPNWNLIAARLVESGTDPASIEQFSVVIILTLLKKSLEKGAMGRQPAMQPGVPNSGLEADNHHHKKLAHRNRAIAALSTLSAILLVASILAEHWHDWWAHILSALFVAALLYLLFSWIRR